jgi:hypothetical protein
LVNSMRQKGKLVESRLSLGLFYSFELFRYDLRLRSLSPYILYFEKSKA